MSEDNERSRRLIKKLSKLVAQLSSDIDNSESSEKTGPRKDPSGDVAVCVPKSLPDQFQLQAARTAVRYNPLNAPVALGALRGLDSEGEAPSPARIAVDVKRYWGPSQRTLTVSFMESTSEALANKIISHMNAWTKTAGISFRRTSSGGNVRITRAQSGYWSYVGTDILHINPSSATMCLNRFTENTSEGEYRRVVRHEAGHTLGFPHEHMRQEFVARLDRQKCYEYYGRTQGWSRQMVDQQVLTPLDKMSIFSTPPDQTSIMCYQIPGSLTKDGQPILGGSDINRTDYWFAGRIYPKAGAQSSPEAMLAALSEDEHAENSVSNTETEDSGFTAQPLEL